MIAIPLAIIFLSIIVQPDQKLIQDYQRNRIMSFLYPENEEYADDIEQQNNSKQPSPPESLWDVLSVMTPVLHP